MLEVHTLALQHNLANSYCDLGLLEKGLSMRKVTYSETLKLLGKENEHTFLTANSYASSLLTSGRFEEVKSLLCDLMPLARRTLGEGHELTLKMRKAYARALYENKAATLDDLHEAVTTLEDSERTVRRVFGNAHPNTAGSEHSLRNARAALRARETGSAP